MDCSEIRRFLHAYIDCEFDEREQIEFELHLAQCPCCREEVNYYRALRRTLRKKVPCKLAPIHLEALIRETIDHEVRVQRGWFSLSMATVGAFVLALGTFLWSSNVSDTLVAQKHSNSGTVAAQNVSFETSQQDQSNDKNVRKLTTQMFLRNIIQRAKKVDQAQNSPTDLASMEPENSRGILDVSAQKPTISLRHCDFPGHIHPKGNHHKHPWCKMGQHKVRPRLINANYQP